MRKVGSQAYFFLCGVLGWLLRSGRYSTARIIEIDGARVVQKCRLGYAPLLIRLGEVLFNALNTGVRVLPQAEWEGREHDLYQHLYGHTIRIEHRTLLLPCFMGESLATLLESPHLSETSRQQAIRVAVAALAHFHRLGLSHGDAMAENVLVDLESGAAYWIDFETRHDENRPLSWRYADDLRALLATCLIRSHPANFAATLTLIMDTYGEPSVTRLVSKYFTSVWQRPLPFHLAQAKMSLQTFHLIKQLLDESFSSLSMDENDALLDKPSPANPP